jgi:GTPase
VTEVWSVPYVGTVVNGIINGGRIKVGDSVMLGPDSNGNYLTTVVKDMQRKRFVLLLLNQGSMLILSTIKQRVSDER